MVMKKTLYQAMALALLYLFYPALLFANPFPDPRTDFAEIVFLFSPFVSLFIFCLLIIVVMRLGKIMKYLKNLNKYYQSKDPEIWNKL